MAEEFRMTVYVPSTAGTGAAEPLPEFLPRLFMTLAFSDFGHNFKKPKSGFLQCQFFKAFPLNGNILTPLSLKRDNIGIWCDLSKSLALHR